MKQELLQKKGELVTQANEILRAAEQDGKRLVTKDEETKFNALHADIEAITKQVTLIDKQADAERSLTEVGQRVTQPNAVPSGAIESRLIAGARDHQDAVRGWFLAGAPTNGPVPKHMQDAAHRVGLDLHGKQLNFRLASRAMQGMDSEARKLWQQHHEEQRAMAGPQNTTSVGGFAIQDEAMREIEIALLQFGGVRQNATVLRTATGGPLPIPTVNDTTNVGAIVGEGITVGTQDAVFGQLVLDAWKYTSKSVLVSVELMQDSAVNLPQMLGRLLGERIGRIQNTHFTTGTGTTNPNGVVTAATFAQATTGNTTAITYANLIALYHSVDPAYRNTSKFMMNDNSISKIKLMTDSQGRPLWLPGLVDRAPDTILGSPYVINQDMSSMTISGKSILFGDFSKYLIRDVTDFTMLRLDERFAEFLQVAFLAFMRSDGDLLNAGTVPIRGYQNST